MTNKALMEIKKETADIVLAKVQHFQKQKELDLPPNYSAANALKSAWLILQETVDKDKKPALSVCTKASIANALLDMVIQGLNPAKDQCYFIVRRDKLCMDRSYFGAKSVALRVDKSLADINSEVIYNGDELEFTIVRGKRVIEKHTQKFTNIDDSKIVGAYAEAINKNGEVTRSEIMTLDQIHRCWKQSQMTPFKDDGSLKENSTHFKFPGMMCRRTVTNRLANQIINSSDDSGLVIKSVRRTDDERSRAEAEMEISEEANQGEVIDISPPGQDDDSEPEDSIEMTGEIQTQEMQEAEDFKTEGGGPGF